MIQLRAVVERITYFNEENGYSILKARVKQYRDLVTVVGTFPPMYIGTVLLLQGEWTIDPKYGQQFCCSSYEEALPATALGIEKYIGSGLIRGVGPSIAKKIVQTFGEKTLEVMDEQPELLLTVSGIGKKRLFRFKTAGLNSGKSKTLCCFFSRIMFLRHTHLKSISNMEMILSPYSEKILISWQMISGGSASEQQTALP